MTNPAFIMLIGMPCSGKSTWVERNISEEFTVLSTDNLIEREARKLGVNYSEAFNLVDLRALEREMFMGMDVSLGLEENIVVDRTNLSSKKRALILKKVPDCYEKIAVVFAVDNSIQEERNSLRGEETGKIIPLDVIRAMRASFSPPRKSEGFDYIFEIRNGDAA